MSSFILAHPLSSNDPSDLGILQLHVTRSPHLNCTCLLLCRFHGISQCSRQQTHLFDAFYPLKQPCNLLLSRQHWLLGQYWPTVQVPLHRFSCCIVVGYELENVKRTRPWIRMTLKTVVRTRIMIMIDDNDDGGSEMMGTIEKGPVPNNNEGGGGSERGVSG